MYFFNVKEEREIDMCFVDIKETASGSAVASRMSR
jgi:hypothetical protein